MATTDNPFPEIKIKSNLFYLMIRSFEEISQDLNKLSEHVRNLSEKNAITPKDYNDITHTLNFISLIASISFQSAMRDYHEPAIEEYIRLRKEENEQEGKTK